MSSLPENVLTLLAEWVLGTFAFSLYSLRHHYEEQMVAEQNDDDVDTVRYAKKRRYLEGSTHPKVRGRSCTDTEW